MNEQPLVTVAMVTYNSEKYVAMAIETVLSSSYGNIELVIADDRSKDNTWGIIQSFSDPRIKAIQNERNLGEYSNRNQCIELAKGEYLIFIDGDDMVYPHGIEFMTKMLHSFPDCGMALMRWYKNNVFYPVVVQPREFYQGLYFQYGFNDIAFANTFFKTSALRAAGAFPAKIKSGDDYIRFKIGREYPVLLINDHLTFWRETPGQASSVILNSLAGQIEKFNLYFEHLYDSPLTSEEVVEARANLKIQIVQASVRMIRQMQFAEGWKLWRQYRMRITDMAYYFRKPKYKDPFASYTPCRVCMEPLSKNPFSKPIHSTKNVTATKKNI